MFTAITSSDERRWKDIGGPVFADDAGRTWFAPVTGGLFCLEGDSVKRIPVAGLDNDVIYSIDGSKDELWLGRQHGGLTELTRRNGEWIPRTLTQRDGLAQDSVDTTVTRAHDGSVWAGTVSGGISVAERRAIPVLRNEQWPSVERHLFFSRGGRQEDVVHVVQWTSVLRWGIGG